MRPQRVYEMVLSGGISPVWERGSRGLTIEALRPSGRKLQSIRSLAASYEREDFWFCCGLPLALLVASITVLV